MMVGADKSVLLLYLLIISLHGILLP